MYGFTVIVYVLFVLHGFKLVVDTYHYFYCSKSLHWVNGYHTCISEHA